MKINFSYLPFVILLLALGYILVDFGPSVSLLGNKEALEEEKLRLKEQRETAEIRVDSLSAFIDCICEEERINCDISKVGKKLVCKFPIAKSRAVESVFLCGLGRADLKGRLDFKEDNAYLTFNFPIEKEFAILPSICPACLASKHPECGD